MQPHDPQGFLAPSARSDELRPRLLVAYLSVGLVILVSSLFAALMLRSVDKDAELLVRNVTQRATKISRLRQEFLLLRVAEKNLIIEESQEGMDVFEKRITDADARIELLSSSLIPEEDAGVSHRMGEFRRGLEAFRRSLHETIELSRENTLARAAELSRGLGHDLFQQGREALLRLIERNRREIAVAASTPASAERVERLTAFVSAARDALEGMHDLQYLEQASLTTFSQKERAGFADRIEQRQSRVRELLTTLAGGSSDDDRADTAAFAAALDAWTANNKQVLDLAQRDTKARAMQVSTSAVRDAYLLASETLDRMLEESDGALQALRDAQEQSLRTGRRLLIGTAAAGLLLMALTAWLAVNLVVRDYRSAADVVMQGL